MSSAMCKPMSIPMPMPIPMPVHHLCAHVSIHLSMPVPTHVYPHRGSIYPPVSTDTICPASLPQRHPGTLQPIAAKKIVRACTCVRGARMRMSTLIARARASNGRRWRRRRRRDQQRAVKDPAGPVAGSIRPAPPGTDSGKSGGDVRVGGGPKRRRAAR